jgi:hypothetical protein
MLHPPYWQIKQAAAPRQPLHYVYFWACLKSESSNPAACNRCPFAKQKQLTAPGVPFQTATRINLSLYAIVIKQPTNPVRTDQLPKAG